MLLQQLMREQHGEKNKMHEEELLFSHPQENSPTLATVIKVVPTANNGSPELLNLHHEQVSAH